MAAPGERGATPGPTAARAQGPLAASCYGLHAATGFELATGATAGAAMLRQAAWYFRDEIVAVPRAGLPVAGFARGVRPEEDLRRWLAGLGATVPRDLPPLVWVAARGAWDHCQLAPDGATAAVDGRRVRVRWVPKIPLNRAYLDASSFAFLSRRGLRLRGAECGGALTIRTVWPADWRLPPRIEPRVLAADARASLRALMREAPRGGAAAPFAALRLWSRTAEDAPPGAPVLAFLVNGGQGDDDEAHAGHFAIVTGRVGTDGGLADWLVNDFYSLDSESEKGILAAPVPLDNYQGDLNAGQSWYRPSVLVVAVLRDAAAAELVQSALGRVYNQFYRRQLVYDHAHANCTCISVDTLRTLGLRIAMRPAAHPLLATAGFPLLVLRERSVARAKLHCGYLGADPTRLLPAAALEEVFSALMDLTAPAPAAGAPPRGRLATLLARDLGALVFARIPQLPSSRAWGDAPVATLADYFARLPRPPAKPVIVPVPARRFPAELRDPDLLPPPWRRPDFVAAFWGIVLVCGIPAVLRALWRRWKPRWPAL